MNFYAFYVFYAIIFLIRFRLDVIHIDFIYFYLDFI